MIYIILIVILLTINASRIKYLEVYGENPVNLNFCPVLNSDNFPRQVRRHAKIFLNVDFNIKLFFQVSNEFRRSVSKQTIHANFFSCHDIFLNVVDIK